jgi:hypothetical protein
MIIKNNEDSKLDDVAAFLNGREVGICTLNARIDLVEFVNTKNKDEKVFKIYI